MDLRNIPENDYPAINKIESIVNAFSQAVFGHVVLQPHLRAAFEASTGRQDRVIVETINNMRHMLPNPYEAKTPEEHRHILAQQSILAAQENDRCIAIAQRFLRPETIADLMPKAAMKHPAVYISVMEKYGLRHSASALSYKLALAKG